MRGRSRYFKSDWRPVKRFFIGLGEALFYAVLGVITLYLMIKAAVISSWKDSKS